MSGSALGNVADVAAADPGGDTATTPTRSPTRRLASSEKGFALPLTFASTTLRYGLTIFPSVARELAHWRMRAGRISDPTLRRLALEALAKRGNMEGAALFAVLAPRAHRKQAIRALVAFQAAYNYLDLLAEQPSDDAEGNSRRLHEALILALDPGGADGNFHAGHSQRADRGYLDELIEATRGHLASLPSYASVADSARAAAARIVEFQSWNLGERQGGYEGLERWAREQTPPGSGLHWWESAAASGSSLGVHVLVALAALPELDREQIAAVEDAYHPWIGALHSMLDSLVDIDEDQRTEQRNLLRYYASSEHASARLARLGEHARLQTRRLAHADRHEAILVAMACYYLSAPTARARELRPIARAVVDASGPLARPALHLFKAARVASRLVRPKR